MKKSISIIGLAILILVILGVMFFMRTPQPTHILAYVGSGMRLPMQEIKKIYEEQHQHITVDYSFSGSKVLEQTIRSLSKGDVFMPGDKKYINALGKDNFIIAEHPVALHIPAIIVRQGETKVTSWADLAKEDVKLCFPNAKMASIGKITNAILSRSPLEQKIKNNVITLAIDTAESVKFLLEQKVDAVISWRSMGIKDNLKVIDIPKEINKIQEIWIAVPKFTSNQTEAQKFAKFVAGPDGQRIFSKMGFKLMN
ncbi:molybdate ABC transporter substrate-binding protein [Candidatus Halobeggiatoa sp. HSG11]|nr:molybdate ABC transporter substrate-binding protein [Candidatus Halobeggiatoa sp. HSG11]